MSDNRLKFTPEVQETVKDICEEIAGTILKGQEYDSEKANEWANAFAGGVTQKLNELQLGFKFAVNVNIIPANSGILHLAVKCLWDPNTDGSCNFKYNLETMHCLVNVLAFAP